MNGKTYLERFCKESEVSSGDVFQYMEQLKRERPELSHCLSLLKELYEGSTTVAIAARCKTTTRRIYSQVQKAEAALRWFVVGELRMEHIKSLTTSEDLAGDLKVPLMLVEFALENSERLKPGYCPGQFSRIFDSSMPIEETLQFKEELYSQLPVFAQNYTIWERDREQRSLGTVLKEIDLSEEELACVVRCATDAGCLWPRAQSVFYAWARGEGIFDSVVSCGITLQEICTELRLAQNIVAQWTPRVYPHKSAKALEKIIWVATIQSTERE